MQSLYEWDFKGKRDEMLPEIISHNIKEFAPETEDPTFIVDLVNGPGAPHGNRCHHRRARRGEPTDQIAAVTAPSCASAVRTVRQARRSPRGRHQRKYRTGKAFGGESSGRFVNVLGTVYKDGELARTMHRRAEEREERIRPEDSTAKLSEANNDESPAAMHRTAGTSATGASHHVMANALRRCNPASIVSNTRLLDSALPLILERESRGNSDTMNV
jgi:hypothetical protein